MPVAESGPVSASVLPIFTVCACANVATSAAMSSANMCFIASPLGLQDDFARPGARVDQAMRGRRLRKRHQLVDQHAIASFRRRLEPELDIARQYLAERAVNRELLEIELLRIERHRAAAVRAGCHQPSEARQASEGLGEELRVADVLEHDVHALAVGDALDLRGQILLAIVDAVIRAESDGGLHSLVSAGGSDHLGAEILRHLDARGAEAAGRAHDQDRLAAYELRGIAQEAESGRRVTRDDGSGGENDALWNRDPQRCRHTHITALV